MEQLQHPLAAGAARPAHRDPMGGWEPQLCGALISGHLGPFLCPLSSAKPLREEPGDWQKMGTFTSKWAHSPNKWAFLLPKMGIFTQQTGTFTQQMGTFTPKRGTFTPKWALSPNKWALSPQNGRFHPRSLRPAPGFAVLVHRAGILTRRPSARLFCLFPEPRSEQPTRSTQSRGFS